MTTASVILIGDELLSGTFADQNGPFLIRRLRELHVTLERLVVVRDVLDEIAAEVARCAASSTYVITTGGVGPTHDDRTLEGVARAFDLDLEVREEILTWMVAFGMAITPMTQRMATLPVGAALLTREGSGKLGRYPVIQVRNVFVFPGVPALMQAKFEHIADLLVGRTGAVGKLWADDEESSIADALADVAARFPDVAIGSYPRFGEETGALMLTFQGHDELRVRAAIDACQPWLRVRRVEAP
jgi:molybdenum cofactor synthesis domain-containing protein